MNTIRSISPNSNIVTTCDLVLQQLAQRFCSTLYSQKATIFGYLPNQNIFYPPRLRKFGQATCGGLPFSSSWLPIVSHLAYILQDIALANLKNKTKLYTITLSRLLGT